MTQMTTARFAALVEAYGGDPARWPAEERDGARALIAADPSARRALDEAAALDAVLDRAPAEPPSAELATRILAAAPVPPAGRARSGRVRRLRDRLAGLLAGLGGWQPVGAMAAALILGLVVGYAADPFGGAVPLDGGSLDAVALGTFAEPEATL
jgi:hypothetical protein